MRGQMSSEDRFWVSFWLITACAGTVMMLIASSCVQAVEKTRAATPVSASAEFRKSIDACTDEINDLRPGWRAKERLMMRCMDMIEDGSAVDGTNSEWVTDADGYPLHPVEEQQPTE